MRYIERTLHGGMMKRALLMGIGVVAAALGGCGGGSSDGVGSLSSPLRARLQPLADCNAVDGYLKEVALKEMNKALDEALSQFEKQPENYCYYGANYRGGGVADAQAGGAPPTSPSPSGGGGSEAGGAKSASTTNNQVAGVDEADFVKNDNKFIYAVANGSLHIIEAWPAPGMHALSKVKVEGTPRKLFVEGDRAFVYSSVPRPPEPNDPNDIDYGRSAPGGMSSPGGGISSNECTYGYGCDFTGDGHQTLVTVFDIADKTAPKSVRSIKLTGSLIAARRIGTGIHTVVSDPNVRFKGIKLWPEDVKCPLDTSSGSGSTGSGTATPSTGVAPRTIIGGDEPVDNGTGSSQMTSAQRADYVQRMRTAIAKLRTENEKIIREANVQERLPKVEDSVGGQPGSNALAQCGGFYRSSISDGEAFTTILSVDIKNDAGLNTSTIVSRPGAVYASGEALYMAVRHTRPADDQPWFEGHQDMEYLSTIHKFRIDQDFKETGYMASGIAKGHVLNQFSMDEKDGYLRFAASNGQVPSKDVHSTLSVLQQQGDDLEVVGKVDQLAPGEDIRSVRFDGERGYVVTFKKTDPLFVFDLKDPKNPLKKAELKIPGFSTYMHMLDDTHLLTIGYDADDQGRFAWFTGVMLQIFDVTDSQNPTLLHKEIIGTRGSSSEALTNHLAFNFFREKNLLGLPITVCEDSSGSTGGGSYGDTLTFSGLKVYNVTSQSGFSLVGGVTHPQDPNIDDRSLCSNWWTRASSDVKRSVFMDDIVFSISESRIKANSLANLGQDLAEVSLK